MTVPAPVSVVIPAFNAARFLPATVASLRAQTLPPAEILVVDDGSTDNTGPVARELGVRYIHRDNGGPAAARNLGVQKSTERLVAFLDADDAFLREKLEWQMQHLLDHSGAVASCTDAWVVRDGQRVGRKNAHRKLRPEIDLEQLLKENPVICSTVLARREAVLDVGGFDEDRELIATEDYDLWLRLAPQGPFVYVDEPLSEYRVHGDSLSDAMTFMRGVDRIAEKITPTLGGDVSLLTLLQRLRAGLRLSVAYDRARTGEGREARALLREARRMGAPRWPAFKILLRSLR